MDYRREIDGLRALAVIPVILFHAGFEAFSGGYVGVDVFFVISGYLITTIILTALEQGKFSLVEFYERRARRILPALFLVMFACLPFAWRWLLPSDMQDFARSLVAVPLFVSNVLFWRESGYFEAAAELKPLLHTWSLAVEEQYYVLFPLFLMFAWRFGKRSILVVLGLIFLASLALAQWASLEKPVAAFYLLPTRGWELLLGAFVAFYLSAKGAQSSNHAIKELGALSGLLLLLYAIFAFDKDTPFPGLYTLVPTVGTALLILFANKETLTGRLLGWKVFVGIGLISYSAYLWHQPLFAFARYRILVDHGGWLFFSLFIGVLALSYLSWKYVEGPFRHKCNFTRKQVFSLACFVSLVFVGMGLAGQFTHGALVSRPNLDQLQELEARVVTNYGLHSDCEGKFTVSANCRTSDEPEVLVWGDSYAMHLVQGLMASKADLKLVQMTSSSCGPLLDIAPISKALVRRWAEDCIGINDQVFDYLRNTASIKYVVMSSPLNQYVGPGTKVLTRSGEVVDDVSAVYDAMQHTIEQVKQLGKVPVIFSPSPQDGQNVGRCLVKATIFKMKESACDVRLSDSEVLQRSIFEFLKRVESINPVVWLKDGMCEDGICKASASGIFIYRDDGHLSHEGSAYLGQKMGWYERLVAAPVLGR